MISSKKRGGKRRRFFLRGKLDSALPILLLLAVGLGGGILFWAGKGFPEELSLPGKEKGVDYCETDSDCVCGVHEETGECFVGNREYAEDEKGSEKNVVCPDFCSGFAGNLKLKCLDNQCRQVASNRGVYRNEAFGFEVEYPSSLDYVTRGPNKAQKKLERGETISGTVQPSYETVVFSSRGEEVGREEFRISIFQARELDISKTEYNSSLQFYGSCDPRWGFEAATIKKIRAGGTDVLKVEGEERSRACYYFKNEGGKIMVLSGGGPRVSLKRVIKSLELFEENSTHPVKPK